MITQSELKELLSYDKDTGIFRWKNKQLGLKAGTVAGTTSGNGYINISIKYKLYLAHRLAWLYEYGEFPNGQLDHINGNKSDNSIGNLRDVSQSTNQENRVKAHANNKSGYLGVHYSTELKKFIAKIQVNKKRIHLGCFNTAEDASLAYLKAKRELHTGCTI